MISDIKNYFASNVLFMHTFLSVVSLNVCVLIYKQTRLKSLPKNKFNMKEFMEGEYSWPFSSLQPPVSPEKFTKRKRCGKRRIAFMTISFLNFRFFFFFVSDVTGCMCVLYLAISLPDEFNAVQFIYFN